MQRVGGTAPVPLRVLAARRGPETATVLEVDGTVDLTRRTGSVRTDVGGISSCVAEALGGPVPICWTASRGRTEGGVLGRVADLVEALPALAAKAQHVRAEGSGRWRFAVCAADAQARGIRGRPASPPIWPGEARADARGRLRRVVLRVAMPELKTGRLRLPEGADIYRIDLR